VLVVVGADRKQRHYLMDVKEAIAAVAPRSPTAQMPSDNAKRVVTGARNLSPFLGSRMVAGSLLDKSVFIWELLPQDLKIEIEHLTRDEAMSVAEFLAHVVGRGHARQLDDDDCEAWLEELQRNRPRALDVPSWLWASDVDLVAAHEAAYLEHCRRYALAEAA
jgi:uncharacterized protein (DUF2252 family)